MALTNSLQSYGAVARSLHWLTALLILTAIPLGVYANGLPYDTSAALAWKAQVFSLHKTVGVAAFLVALVRILWAITQPRPAPLHPDRRWETRAAEAVHWMLYASLVAVPLSGWVHHAATTGFAPILWPLGQDLPLVPKSGEVAQVAGALHWVFTKLLVASLMLHIAGAVKHAVIDRDATLARMWRGTPAPAAPRPHRGRGPVLAALAVYAAGAGLAVALSGAPQAVPAPVAAGAGNWQVAEGRLTFSLRQMGATVEGRFDRWTAEITFDADTGTGRVEVAIDVGSLTLGAVTEQARGAEFLDAARHPTAIFAAAIARDGEGHVAAGSLTLTGRTLPVTLPFTLEILGNTARMTGTTTLDRRDFGIGQAYADAGTVGFEVIVAVTLTATRS
ncbi:MAG: cytochrome b/b6 domain-containing protein [Gemmobacter sp.]